MGFSVIQTIRLLSVDNSLSIWFLEDNPSYQAYINYQEEFGSDEIFVGMIPSTKAFDKALIKKLEQFHHNIDSLYFVKSSFSLAKANYPYYKSGKITNKKLFNPKRSVNNQKRLLNQLPALSEQLVSKDGKNLFFYIQLKPTPIIENYREDITHQVTTICNTFFKTYHLTGAPVLNEAYSKGIYKESLLFGSLTIVIITLLLLFLLPHKNYLWIALLSVAAPITLLFGIITSFGYALNMISMLIPTILMVYSVSDVVHIINIYHQEIQQGVKVSKIQSIVLAVKKSLTPCFYTTLTTFVGYFALYLSPLPAFKNMGVFTCIGLLLAFLLVYTISIIGFSFLNINFNAESPVLKFKSFSHHSVLNAINLLTSIHKIKIIIGFTAVLIFGLYSIFKIKIDTNSIDLLAEGTAKSDLLLVEQQLRSSSRLQLNITSQHSFLEQSSLKLLENFQDSLKTSSLYTAPISLINLKQFLSKRYPELTFVSLSNDALEQRFKQLNTENNGFYTFVSEDFKTVGITLGVKELKTSELEFLLKDIDDKFISVFGTKDYTFKINGFSVVFAQLNDFILETQFKSFFLAFFVGFLCLLVFIKNLKTTLLVLIPNLLPLALLAIVMRLLQIPLDVSTAMITPIMLGIAMDDTIHLVYKYLGDGSAKKRIDKAMLYTGGALVSTTLALIGGFLIIASSGVPSVRHFGLLCAVTVSIALLTDLFYLPALLKHFDYRVKK